MAGSMFLTVALVSVLLFSAYTDGQESQEPSYLHDPRNVRNKEHIKEHMNELYEEGAEPNLESDEAMDFHYFKLHDYDKNDKLDGLEITAAIMHFNTHDHEEEGGEGGGTTELSEEKIADIVTQVLEMDDTNDDGYIDYFEFTKAQQERKASAQQQSAGGL